MRICLRSWFEHQPRGFQFTERGKRKRMHAALSLLRALVGDKSTCLPDPDLMALSDSMTDLLQREHTVLYLLGMLLDWRLFPRIRVWSSWSSVWTLPVAPLWCDLGFVPNSRGNKAAANLRPMLCLSWNLLPDWSLTNRLSPEKELFELWLQNSTSSMLQRASKRADIFALWPKLCKLWSKEVMLSKWNWLS